MDNEAPLTPSTEDETCLPLVDDDNLDNKDLLGAPPKIREFFMHLLQRSTQLKSLSPSSWY